MSPLSPLRVLSISDQIVDFLQSEDGRNQIANIDLILSCGDLPYYYIENVFETFGVPVFFVRGNHDKLTEFGTKGVRTTPYGAVDVHNRVINHNNLLIAGFEGSQRYKNGPFMYSQSEMWINVFKIIPKLLWNKYAHGRFLDVLITHAPPWKIHDKPNYVHQGFKAFVWLLKTFKPSYHFHGHIHLSPNGQHAETIFGSTKVINTFRYTESVIQPGKRHYAIGSPTQFRPSSLASALDDFRDARRKASIQRVLSSLIGKTANLMAFSDVYEKLGGERIQKRGLLTIPLDAIVGSVGRYEDFTRKFFPRLEQDKERWVRVKTKFTSIDTMPPIDVYQIGEVFFVLDGNHRVSIARQNGETHIKAYVTEIESKVALSPEDQPDDIIIKAQQVKFINDTKLDQIKPGVDFTVSEPGKFRQLRDQIAGHHYLLELERKEQVSFKEAVADWVDAEYLPIVRVTRNLGLLRDFPGRTPTDLYLWIISKQRELAQGIGWEVSPLQIAEDLVDKYSSRPSRVLFRIKDKIIRLLRPEELDPGPPSGDWQKVHAIPRRDDRLFSASLVAISGEEAGWAALEQALVVANKEEGIIRGTHIIPEEKPLRGEVFQDLYGRFKQQCGQQNVESEFVVEKGKVARRITKLARWNDLVVIGLAHPPADQPMARLKSGLRTLIQTNPRPLLVVPSFSPLKHALLAYDGSPKSDEGMFLAAYLTRYWGIDLTVVTASDTKSSRPKVLKNAEKYFLSRQIQAEYRHRVGKPGDVLLDTADDNGCDFIIMGGYGHKPVLEVVMGSTVDQVLREYRNPVLICR